MLGVNITDAVVMAILSSFRPCSTFVRRPQPVLGAGIQRGMRGRLRVIASGWARTQSTKLYIFPCAEAFVRAETDSKSLETMRKFSEQYARRCETAGAGQGADEDTPRTCALRTVFSPSTCMPSSDTSFELITSGQMCVAELGHTFVWTNQ